MHTRGSRGDNVPSAESSAALPASVAQRQQQQQQQQQQSAPPPQQQQQQQRVASRRDHRGNRRSAGGARPTSSATSAALYEVVAAQAAADQLLHAAEGAAAAAAAGVAQQPARARVKLEAVAADAADAAAAAGAVITMHTFNETAAGVPAFLAKLWRLVEDPETNHLIYWQQDGHSFIIQNQAQFARELLPLNYKHNNMASFIRQLNMYGFHKITSIDNGGLKFDKDEMEFTHACFRKDSPYLLEHIKRKIANPKPTAQLAAAQAAAAAAAAAATAASDDARAAIRPETVNKVMNEVKTMRTRQESLDSRFSAMKQENEALWREVAILRQKHAKQQQIVNKLIQFLVTLVQPTRPGGGINTMSGVKRRFQLMINDVPESSKSTASAGSAGSSTGVVGAGGGAASGAANAVVASGDDDLPAIRELTDELLDEEDDYDYGEVASPNITSPQGSGSGPIMMDVTSPSYTDAYGNMEQTSTSIVDHPDSDEDDDDDDDEHQSFLRQHHQQQQQSGNEMHNSHTNGADVLELSPDGQPLNFIVDDVVDVRNVATSSPTQEWLETHILSPQMIKQELQENNGHAQMSQMAHIDSEHTYSQMGEPSGAPAHKRARNSTGHMRSTRPKPSGLHLQIGKNSMLDAGQQQMQQQQQQQQQPQNDIIIDTNTNRNPMLSATQPLAPIAYVQQLQHQPDSQIAAQKRIIAQQQQPAPVATAVYANRSDFVGAEMPSDLFDVPQQQQQPPGQQSGNNTAPAIVDDIVSRSASGSMSPLLGELTTAQFNPMPSSSSSAAAAASGSGGKNMAVTKYGTGKLSGAEDVNLQLDSIQGDLESIKELFKTGDDYTIDSSALMSNTGIGAKNRLLLSPTVDPELLLKIFGDLDTPYGLSLSPDFPMDNNSKRIDDPSGSELMAYQPSGAFGSHGSQVDLSQLLSDVNDKPGDEEEDHHTPQHHQQHSEPDYFAQDLNTPNIERKSITFRQRNNN